MLHLLMKFGTFSVKLNTMVEVNKLNNLTTTSWRQQRWLHKFLCCMRLNQPAPSKLILFFSFQMQRCNGFKASRAVMSVRPQYDQVITANTIKKTGLCGEWYHLCLKKNQLKREYWYDIGEIDIEKSCIWINSRMLKQMTHCKAMDWCDSRVGGCGWLVRRQKVYWS